MLNRHCAPDRESAELLGQHPIAQARGGAWGKKFAERGRGGGLGPLRAGERGAPAAWIQRVGIGGGILGIDGVGHAVRGAGMRVVDLRWRAWGQFLGNG